MTKTAINPKELAKRLLDAKEAYYNDEPTMSDEDFDALEDTLRKADSGNEYFKAVGAKGNSKTKLKHDVPMLSAAKSKTVAEVWAWIVKIGSEGKKHQVEPKIDGLSATVKYNKGKLVHVATRGDGQIGQDISHVQAFIKTIPKNIDCKEELEVRGELYIPKTSKVPNPENKPLRNMAVGFINRKGENHSLDDLKYVKFVAYQVVGKKFQTESAKLEWLEESGFNFIERNLTFTTEAQLSKIHTDYLSTYRSDWEYETDGMVIVVDDISLHDNINSKYEVSHHNHYNMALKPPSEGKETKLIDIEWNVSRQGKLIPVAIVEPVVLGGATVQRCTLNNYENVINLKLHKGDRVIIERANDVIPFFKENLDGKEKAFGVVPKKCTSCNGDLEIEGIHLVCNSSRCVEQDILKVVHWVKACEMEAFAEASVRQLFAAGKIKNIRDLYSLKSSDFNGVDGFGSSKSKNALEQIEATKEMTIGQFVDRLGIDLVGEKAMKKMGITNSKELFAFNDKTFVIGQNLIEYLKENKDFVKDLLECVTITKPQAVKAGSKNVCMTGGGPKKRDELIKDIQAKGDQYVDHVGKDTNILVCEDPASGTSKLAKATKLGVKLMSYSEYFK
jgi:DNA ligase (NAD+)